jgi:hypothetical protein
MKKQPLTPQVGVTYYQKRGGYSYAPEYLAIGNNRQALTAIWMSEGVFVNVDFYAVGKSAMLVKMQLSEKGVKYFKGEVVPPNEVALSPSYFKTHWSTEPEKF